MAHPRFFLCALLGIETLCGPWGRGGICRAQVPDTILARLAAGDRIEHSLRGGQIHSYLALLEADHFVRVVIEQAGIDVVARLYHPDGRLLLEVDSPNGTSGPEPLTLLTDATGDYRIQVAALEPDAASGQYTVTVPELRPSHPSDPQRISAEGQYARGTQIKLAGTAAAFRQAIAILDSAAAGWRMVGDSVRLAVTLLQMGDALKRLGEDDTAITAFEEALALYRAIGDVNGEIGILNQLGIAYDNKEDKARAIQYLEEAIALARRTGNLSMEGSASSNVGHRYFEAGQVDQAREALERAVSIAQQLGDLTQEAPALNNLARFWYVVGEHGIALRQYRRALDLTRVIPDRYGEMQVLNNMGSVFSDLGANERAVAVRLDAIAIARQVGDPRSEAVFLNNLAASYVYLGRPDSALAAYRSVVRIARETQYRSLEAQATEGIGNGLRDHLHDPAGAILAYTNALAIWRELNDRLGESTTLGELGRAYAAAGDRPAAWRTLREALALMRQNRQRIYAIKTLQAMADLAEAEGALDSALALRREGVIAIEALRTSAQAGSLRTSYTATAQSLTTAYIGLLMRLHAAAPQAGHDREAFEAAERSRARTLLDDLSAANVDFRGDADSQLVAAEGLAAARVDSLASRLGRGGARVSPDSATLLHEALSRALDDAEDLRDRLRAESPRYAALSMRALGLAEIQQLLDSSTALLLYAGGPVQGQAWLVTSSTFTSFALLPDSLMAALGRRYLDFLTARNRRLDGETPASWRGRIARARRDLPGVASALSEALFGPVAGLIGARRLLIVPSGAVHLVPVAALPAPHGAVGAGKPMVARGEVVVIPSASTMTVMRELRSRRERPVGTLAVLADPVFSATDPRLAQPATAAMRGGAASHDTESGDLALRAAGVEDGDALPRLPASQEEARAILALVPPGRRLEALGFRASRALALSEELGRYRIVHFATHGFVNLDYPDLSGVALSTVTDRGEPTDGFLRVHQIYRLHLPVDLVVLSACQTALGREVGGEGLIGLSRAFMYAGASAVVASLWKVDDRATAEMMTRFYRHMLGPSGLRPAAALRAAQMEMSRHPRWRDPYYWAAFTVQGDWQ